MAKSSAPASSRRPRYGLWLLALIALGLGGSAWAFREPINGYGSIASAYSARVGCSCRFVAGRSLEDCAKDKVGGMELVSLSEDIEEKSVTARMLVISDTARMKPGYGCVMEPWEN